ncbi:MAG TPA: TetR/AcrR family transcriptional regulator, partial [Candidatus Competibacteraceae bacterium]|nr:TetR/AcrR family transcriptional regulator [Candidatus Competibacteraceae bacterium]
HIADEMNISPGNLYYHFRNKDEIILQLFERFERQMSAMLEAPQGRTADMEDMWLYLHLIFENIWHYRFLYRDLNDLVQRNRQLRSRLRRILERKIRTAAAICQGLVDAGLMQASAEDIEALANNIVVVATYWLNFQLTLGRAEAEATQLARGAYQVLSLVTPFLTGDAQKLLHKLRQVYLG